MDKILIIGACGQLGTELTLKLRELKGTENVIASDLRDEPIDLLTEGPYEKLNIMNKEAFQIILEKHQINQVYHLAAVLSAKGEQNPHFAWQLNMESLLTVLEAGKDRLKKIYWPSSIAVFGPDTPKENTPQNTVMSPNTVYGISKLAGERWCEYYFEKYGVDVRSLRYPGLIGYKAMPGGGTTDYAVDIYHKAIVGEKFECFLSENSMLPMMYMDDAVKATIDLMETDAENVKVRSSYNLAAMSFTPKEIAEEIRNHYPDFEITYNPDFRQKIADSWPGSIDDSAARNNWGWQHKYGLKELTETMITNLKDTIVFD
ncbi:Nucleoside-diphosphate-sugar epimerase [Ekhidna lutea]|uniref:Nucleoside-diphosphate-sugar epimerase n=1 Tax=Ekhidna lutea TaxID=447679 RepID=A0A239IU19_EKHLU|nr:NAD-dependent epimerase/dehydratase family protein [Ekhidna lutea]SNS97276.1 Nucleoside-diphosphate-sugar epimerase [Ekhidna lutea]